MSEVLRLLADFRRRGTQIWAEGAQLRYRVASGSLTATEVGQLRQHKAAILALLAQVSTKPATAFPPIEPVDRKRPLLLSYAQQRLWLLAQGRGASEAYHIPLNFRLRGKLDEAALRHALDYLVRRHETLRTEFDVMDGEPVQRIGPMSSRFNLKMHDLSAAAESQALLAQYELEELQAPFDLTCQSSARGRLIRLKPDEHVLLLTLHHINADGWSMGVLARELSALYAGFLVGKGALLEPPPIQYADYAAWQRRYCTAAVLEQRSAYWRETLANSPALFKLPTDRRRPNQQDFKGASVPVEWDEHFTTGLKNSCRRSGVTLFMALLTAWAVVLSRLSGQQDIVIGSPYANRRVPEVDALVGFFVNTLPLRMRLSDEQTFEQLLLRSREVVTGAQDNQDVPFEQIVELINPVRSAAWSPLVQVMLAWQNNEIGSVELPGLRVEPLSSPVTTAKYDLLWELGESSGRIVGGLNYATSLFDAATAERHVGYLRQVLLK